MWAVAAQPRTGLTPMIPTPSVDSGIARADLTSTSRSARSTRVLGIEARHLGSDRCDRLADQNERGDERVRYASGRQGLQDRLVHHADRRGVLHENNVSLLRLNPCPIRGAVE